jgi:hypothetical protein
MVRIATTVTVATTLQWAAALCSFWYPSQAAKAARPATTAVVRTGVRRMAAS